MYIKADPDIAAATKTEVRVIRIAEYINTVVATRRRPDNSTGAVVMKLDVEVGYNYNKGTKETLYLSCVQGREMRIVSDLLHSGALQHLDSLHVDWPVWLNVKTENGTRVRDWAHAQFRSSMNIEHFHVSTKAFSLCLCS